MDVGLGRDAQTAATCGFLVLSKNVLFLNPQGVMFLGCHEHLLQFLFPGNPTRIESNQLGRPRPQESLVHARGSSAWSPRLGRSSPPTTKVAPGL